MEICKTTRVNIHDYIKYTHIYTHKHKCMRAYVYIYVNVSLFDDQCMYVFMCVYIYIYSHVTHAHTCDMTQGKKEKKPQRCIYTEILYWAADALSCKSLSAKKQLIIGLFCAK